MTQTEPGSDLPLSGTTVLELGDSASAPFAGFVLACLGAEVWKVERPETGDSSRSWGSEAERWDGAGAVYHALNRGKKSVVIDLKDPDDLDRLKTFVDRHADVFLHNLRPGTSGNFGLDEETMLQRKPELLYCSVGAFGMTGPLNHLPGFDSLVQGFSGIMSVTGEPGQAPVRVGVSVLDFGTGLWAALGIVASLLAQRNGGTGGRVDSSLFETALSWMTAHMAGYQGSGETPVRMGSGISFFAPYKAYEASDGYLMIACGNDRLFAKLCNVLGTVEWIDDPRFATNAARVANRALLDELIEAELKRHPRESWQAQLEAAGVPCTPIQTVDEVVRHEQTDALGILSDVPGDSVPLVSLPISLAGHRPRPTTRAPGLGEHAEEFDAALSRAGKSGR